MNNMFTTTLAITFTGLLIGAICFLCFFVQYKKMNDRKNLLQAQLDLKKQHMEMIEQQLDQHQRFLDELQEQIDILDRYALPDSQQNVRLQKYRQDLVETRESLLVPTYCQNPILNAVFIHKQNECQEKNISLTLNLSHFNCDFIQDVDMIGILYNLFDNAIEACCQMEISQNRFITVTCQNQEKETLIQIINSKDPVLQLPKNRKTWKSDFQDHGLGLEILRNLIKKYKGTLTITEHPDEYLVTISFPG